MRAAVAVTVLALAACGGGSEGAAPPPPKTEARDAPAIAGRTLDGERVALDQFRGRPVLVNVWSSW